MLLHDVVIQVSVDLNDHAPGHEFTTWSDTQLTAYVIEGLGVAYSLRPDLFLSNQVIKLQPGSALQDACGCTQIRRVLGVCTKDGRVLYSIRKRTQSDKLNWNGPSCPADPRHYKVREYAVDNDGDYLFVYPTPPAGQDIYLLVECAVAPTADNVSDIPTELVPPAIQWALYRSKMMDSENSVSIFSVAKEHKDMFFKLLRVQYIYKDMIESDEVKTQPVNTSQTAISLQRVRYGQ